MKKTIVIALCVCIAISVTACSQSDVITIEPETFESQNSSRVIAEPSLSTAESLQIVAESSAVNEAAPYLRLIGKELSELTSDDFKLLLTTPVEKLANIYDIRLRMPPEMSALTEDSPKTGKLDSDIIKQELNRFHGRGYSCELPFGSLSFQYNDIGPEVLPMYLEAYSLTEKINGLQLGATMSEIMEEWGETEKQVYGTGPYGYSGALYQYIEYKERNGFDYHFECDGYADRNESWHQLDESEWPWDDFPQVITYVIISLEGNGTFYVR